MESGYLEEITVKEGQAVKKGDVMFKIVQTLYQAKWTPRRPRPRFAQLELMNIQEVVPRKSSVSLRMRWHCSRPNWTGPRPRAELANAELNFTKVKAPFDGIVDRLHEQHGSLIKEGDILTTLSDNSVMWVYFNVPEKRYLEYMASSKEDKENQKIELELANHDKFPQPGKIGAIEAQIQQRDREHPLPGGFSEPGRPAASRSDRHHPDPPNAARMPSSSHSGRLSRSSTSDTFGSSTKMTWCIRALITIKHETGRHFRHQERT